MSLPSPRDPTPSEIEMRHISAWAAQQSKQPRQFAVPVADSGFSVTPIKSWYLPAKRVADFVFAIILLVLASPLMLIGVLLVKLTSRGPAFYRQVKLGKDGRPFTSLKLRTMRLNAEAETGPVRPAANDPRITPVGRLLRTTHFDEFPQLFNVALGQMSLVGPRPERPEFVAKLDWEIPYYRERLKIRPGIIGLAELRLPPDDSLEYARRKTVHDIYYVRHVSPILDIKLIILTTIRFCKAFTMPLGRLFRLPLAKSIDLGFRVFRLPQDESINLGFQEAVGITNPATVNSSTLTRLELLRGCETYSYFIPNILFFSIAVGALTLAVAPHFAVHAFWGTAALLCLASVFAVASVRVATRELLSRQPNPIPSVELFEISPNDVVQPLHDISKSM